MLMHLYPHIVADPEILAGEPVVEGSRVPARLLIEQVASGESIEEVAHANGVTVEDVRAALEYGAQRVGERVQMVVDQAMPRDDSSELSTMVAEQARALGLDPAALTPFGRRLLAQRAKIIASGIPLLTWDELDAEIAQMRNETRDEQ